MNIRLTVYALLLLLGASLSFILFFSYRTKSSFQIVCTTSIIADTVKQIVGDTVQVKALMGPGVDPHLYRPRESDVLAIAHANIIFYNGLHLEGKMGELFAHMQKTIPTYAVADALDADRLLESEFKGMYDPHIWHDVSLWIQVTKKIIEQVCVHYPEYADVFTRNGAAYIQQLQNLHDSMRERVAKLPESKRIVVTGHDAFAYFGRAYGFQVVGLQGISTDSQVSGKDVMNLAEFIVAHDICALFLESSIPSRNIEAVQRAVAARGKKVIIADELFSDALGDSSTTVNTYYGMIQHNVNTIINALCNECT